MCRESGIRPLILFKAFIIIVINTFIRCASGHYQKSRIGGSYSGTFFLAQDNFSRNYCSKIRADGMQLLPQFLF